MQLILTNANGTSVATEDEWEQESLGAFLSFAQINGTSLINQAGHQDMYV